MEAEREGKEQEKGDGRPQTMVVERLEEALGEIPSA